MMSTRPRFFFDGGGSVEGGVAGGVAFRFRSVRDSNGLPHDFEPPSVGIRFFDFILKTEKPLAGLFV
jgi:hypothetical protein